MSTKALFVTWEPKAALDGVMQLDPWEELAYRRILDLIYVSGNRLVDDDKKLAWMTKTGSRWTRIRKTLFAGDAPKLYVADGYVRNKKCDEKLAGIDQKVAQNRRAGKASAAKRKRLKNNETGATAVAGAGGDAMGGAGDAPPQKTSTPGLPIHLTSEPPSETTVSSGEGAPESQRVSMGESQPEGKRATRLNAQWRLPPELRRWAEDAGLAPARIGPTAERFRDYWMAQPGQKGVKADWPATWRNWVRRDVDDARAPRAGSAANGGQADAINAAFADAAESIRAGRP